MSTTKPATVYVVHACPACGRLTRECRVTRVYHIPNAREERFILLNPAYAAHRNEVLMCRCGNRFSWFEADRREFRRLSIAG